MFCVMKLSAFLANMTIFSSSASENVPYLYLKSSASLSIDPILIAGEICPWRSWLVAMSAIIGERNLVERSCKVFFLIRCSPFVMVLFGLLGDVHKDNFTWNLKAFDEFQSLLNLPV